MCVAFENITDRKKAEKALRTSHEMFLTVLDSIDASIYVADMDTHEILFMNRHMKESFGRDLTGEICWQAFRGETGPCERCTNHRLLDEAGRAKGVVVWQDKNPITGKWYINHDRAIQWVDDRTVRLQIATDISKLKQMESQLQQAQKMEAIGTLAGGIAHDFNNILSAVIGYAELSFDEVEPGSHLKSNLGEIHRAGMRAKDLVKQILTFARQADEDVKPLKVSTIAREALKLLRSTLPASIGIDSRIQSDSPVMADPTQIHQIFMNLCTNAAHAMEYDGGTLRVDVFDIRRTGANEAPGVDLEPGDYLKITVADTGKGIDEQNLPLIFEPYFTTKPTGEGTGLGLSVVHGIVKGYGGEISVESAPGQGTVFSIYLPVIRRTEEIPSDAAGALSTGTERILFVDDEPTICKMSSRLLTRLGYHVTSRTRSLEALALFRTRSDDFDLVITDMTMPEMNGDRLAAEIMAIRPKIPVILCTGYSKRISDEKAACIGIKAFALKPIAAADLAATVREVLDAPAAAK